MTGIDLVRVKIVKNQPTVTGGPGGRLAPLACGIQVWRGA